MRLITVFIKALHWVGSGEISHIHANISNFKPPMGLVVTSAPLWGSMTFSFSNIPIYINKEPG
jgi:hypothetical protein